MAITLQELLQPQVILDLVSTVRKGRGRLGQWFGFHATRYDAAEGVMGGPNTTPSPTRSGTYRIFDHTRTVSDARAPGTGPALIQRQAVGEVAYTALRWHEKLRLLGEELGALSKVIGPNSIIDPGGQDYIANETRYLVERINNAVEYAAWGMTRGTLYIACIGERWLPTLTLPTIGVNGVTAYITVNYQIPAANKSQLNMLGAGDIIGTTWANAAAPIITDLMQIDEAFVNLTGDSLTDVWIDGPGWINVISNTQVINSAGSANTPFASFDRVAETGFDGETLSEYTAVLRGYPTVTWHIINDVLIDPVTGSKVKAVPTNTALFSGKPDREWVDFIYCGEHVSEQPGQPMVLRQGWHFWPEWITQPTCVELIGLFNGIPRLKRPKGLAFGTVVF